jgi:hypothetical protein
VGALVAFAALALAPSASALSGTPINIGTPFESGPPAVAVDSSGTAFVAWANTKDLSPVTTNIVQYCVLPPGAKACAYSGSLTPADSGSNIDHVQVLVDQETSPETIVVLADVYGTAGETAGEYIPEQEWQSTDGGQAFSVVDGGQSVASGILSADTAPLSAVIVPGAGALGYGWDSAAGNEAHGAVPTFDEFPLSSPPQCSTAKCPTEEAFASLEPNSNPDPIGNPFGQYASQPGTKLGINPGVLAVFETDFSNGTLACAPGFGTAYAYASGDQSAANSYDISPGSAGSAWKVAISQADCNVEYPAVGGGPNGFGVLEENTASHSIVYHPFDQTHENFDTPQDTVIANQGELDPSISQDGSGGLYATFLLGGDGGPVALAYSGEDGKSWAGPVTLDPDTAGGIGSLTSSVGSGGQGWAAWTENGSVFAQQFDKADTAVLAPAIAPTASTTGASVTITITCATTPCTVTITITIGGAMMAAHTGATTLASATFTITGKGPKRLSLHLTKAGKRLLSRHHGHLKANVRISAKTAAGLGLTTRAITIIAKHKR